MSRAAGAEATRFFDPVVRPIVKATDLGSRPGAQAGQPVPALRPVRRRPPRQPRAGPVRRRHPPAVGLDPARERRAPGAPPGVGRRQLPRRDPADQPPPRAQRRRQGPAGGRPRLAEARHRAQAGHRGRDARGARPDRELRRGRRAGRGDARACRRRRRHLRGPRLDTGRARPPAADRDPARPGHVPLRRPRRARTSTFVAFSERADTVEAVEPDVAGSVNAGWVRLTWR